MRKCAEIRDVMQQALDGGCGVMTAELQQHLDSCTGCAELWEQLCVAEASMSIAASGSRTVDDEPSPVLCRRIMQAVAREPDVVVRPAGKRWAALLAAAAVLIVVALVTVKMVWTASHGERMPVQVAVHQPVPVPSPSAMTTPGLLPAQDAGDQPGSINNAAADDMAVSLARALAGAATAEAVKSTREDYVSLSHTIVSNVASAVVIFTPPAGRVNSSPTPRT